MVDISYTRCCILNVCHILGIAYGICFIYKGLYMASTPSRKLPGSWASHQIPRHWLPWSFREGVNSVSFRGAGLPCSFREGVTHTSFRDTGFRGASVRGSILSASVALGFRVASVRGSPRPASVMLSFLGASVRGSDMSASVELPCRRLASAPPPMHGSHGLGRTGSTQASVLSLVVPTSGDNFAVAPWLLTWSTTFRRL